MNNDCFHADCVYMCVCVYLSVYCASFYSILYYVAWGEWHKSRKRIHIAWVKRQYFERFPFFLFLYLCRVLFLLYSLWFKRRVSLISFFYAFQTRYRLIFSFYVVYADCVVVLLYLLLSGFLIVLSCTIYFCAPNPFVVVQNQIKSSLLPLISLLPGLESTSKHAVHTRAVSHYTVIRFKTRKMNE